MRLRSIISAVHNTEYPHLPFLFTKYKYEPLPTPTCIRLLEISPNVEKNIIRCSLRVFELQHSRSFRALSYTWGESQVRIPPFLRDASSFGGQRRTRRSVEEVQTGSPRNHSIICDGQLIKVHTNLRDALRMLTKALSFVKVTKFYHHLHTEKLRHVGALRKEPGIYRRVLQTKLSVDMGPVYINETRMDVSAASQACSKPISRAPSLRLLLDKHRFSKSSDPRDKGKLGARPV